MLDRKDAAVFRAMCRYAVDNETDSISVPEFATQQKTGSNIDDPIEMIAHARLLEDFRPGVSASISGSGLEYGATTFGLMNFPGLRVIAQGRIATLGSGDTLTSEELGKSLNAGFGNLSPLIWLLTAKYMRDRGWLSMRRLEGNAFIIENVTALGRRGV